VDLWETLLRPDKEELENSDRRAISDAANILEIGEFQLLQLAYRDWYGEDLPEDLTDWLFHSCMIDDVVAPWARHYARKIVREEQSGRLDHRQRRYHRYDCGYSVRTPLDARSICFALGLAAVLIGGGVAIFSFEADPNTSMFPPFLSDKELRPQSRI
jgi:hypothetical protein